MNDNTTLFDDLAGKSLPFLRAIQDLAKANVEFAESTISANKRIKASLIELKAEMERTKEVVISLNTARKSDQAKLTGLKDDILHTITAFKNQNTVLAQNEGLVKANSEVVEQLEARLKHLRSEYGKLDDSQKKDQKRKREIEREIIQSTRAYDGLIKATQKATQANRVMEGSYNALQKETAQIRQQLNDLPDAYSKTTGKINEQNLAAVALNKRYQEQLALLKKIDTGQGVFGRNVGNYSQGMGRNTGAMAGMVAQGASGAATAALGTLGVAVGAFDIAADIARVGSEYEKLDLLVENSFQGNKRLAKEAKAVIIDFANSSPLEVNEVTTAFNRLRDIGINPTRESLSEVSDMAISKGKTIMDWVEAIADAQMGENERLKEFGINARKNGDQVTFTFKGVSTTVENSQKAITNYLMELGKMPGIIGATDRLATSSAGMWSTLKDTFAGIATDLFNKVKPALNGLMGWGTSAAGTLRGLLASSVDNATLAFADQTKKVNELEGELPGLMSRYEELRGKTNKSTTEQKELQNVINRIAEIVPSASTGFDSYGNSLDINKGKVLGFAAAQRQLNAELNKQANAELAKKAAGDMENLAKVQATLNRGTTQQSFNFKPYFMMTAEERRRATAKNEGDRRQVALSDEEITAAKKQLNELKDNINASALQIMSNGGKLDAATRSFIEKSGTMATQQFVIIDEYQKKIADKEAEATVYFSKGALDSFKAKKAEITELRTKLNEILRPVDSSQKQPTLSEGIVGTKTEKAKTALEELKSRIEAIKSLLETQTLQDVKAGRLVSVDPQKVAELEKLQGQLKLIEKTMDAIDQGFFGTKKVIDYGNIDTISQKSGIDTSNLETGQYDKKGKPKTGVQIDAEEAKRTARFEKELQKQLDMFQHFSFERMAMEKSFSGELIGAKESEKKQLLQLLQDIQDAEKAGNKERAADLRRQMSDITGNIKDTQRLLRDVYIEIGTTFVRGMFDLEKERTNNKISELDKQKEYELSLAADSSSGREAIEKKYDSKRRLLLRQQAMQDKQKALFDIAVNTAVNIVKAGKNIPLAIAMGILGLVQAGIVMAKPLPAYKDGKNMASLDTYEGPALVGEAGRELWFNNKGVELIEKPSILNVGRHDRILPNNLTERLLADDHAFEASAIMSRMQHNEASAWKMQQDRINYQASIIARGMRSGPSADAIGKAVAEHLQKLPFDKVVFDSQGFTRYLIDRTTTIKRNNEQRHLGNR